MTNIRLITDFFQRKFLVENFYFYFVKLFFIINNFNKEEKNFNEKIVFSYLKEKRESFEKIYAFFYTDKLLLSIIIIFFVFNFVLFLFFSKIFLISFAVIIASFYLVSLIKVFLNI